MSENEGGPIDVTLFSEVGLQLRSSTLDAPFRPERMVIPSAYARSLDDRCLRVARIEHHPGGRATLVLEPFEREDYE